MDLENTGAVKSETDLGQLLKATRERKGLSVEQVADKLKLKVSTITALERDDYRDLGGTVYIKGYLRSYGKLLDVSVENYLHSLHEESTQLVDTHRDGEVVATKRNRSWLVKDQTGIWTGAFVLGVVVIGAFIWHHHHKVVSEHLGVKKDAIVSTQAPVPIPSATLNASTLLVTPPAVKETKAVESGVTATKPDAHKDVVNVDEEALHKAAVTTAETAKINPSPLVFPKEITAAKKEDEKMLVPADADKATTESKTTEAETAEQQVPTTQNNA